MNHVKRFINGLLGLGSHEVNRGLEDANDVNNGHNISNSVEETPNHVKSNRRRKGISVPVQVPADSSHQFGPIILPCAAGDGGVQKEDPNSVEETPNHVKSNRRRKGISVPVQVPADSSHQFGPIILPCAAGDGGVQGLNWHTRRLKIDEDGDVADEFLEEIVPETSNGQTFSKFQVKLSTEFVKATSTHLSPEGTVRRFVDFRGRQLLV